MTSERQTTSWARRGRRRAVSTPLAWRSVFCLSGLLLVGGLSLLVVDPRLPPGTHTWGFRGFGVLLALTFSITGVLLTARRPGSAMGWILAAAGLATAVQFLAGEYAAAALTRYRWLPGGLVLLSLQTWGWVLEIALGTIFLFLRFPTGQLPGPAWVRVERVIIVAVALACLGQAIKPGLAENMEIATNPLGVNASWALALAVIGLLLLVASIAASLASLVVRYRGAGAVERLQLRWLTYAAGLVLLVSMPAFTVTVSPSLLGRALTQDLQVAFVLSFLAIPVAILIAVLRYRLYDIDRLISRTVSYLLVTGVLLGLYVSLVTVATRVLPISSSLGVAAATLAVAAAFNPLRRRVQAAVDRRFNRARYDATRTVELFSSRLRDEVDLAAVTADLLVTVNATFEPRSSSLWLRGAAGG